jgi:Tol biopolymer transport system component
MHRLLLLAFAAALAGVASTATAAPEVPLVAYVTGYPGHIAVVRAEGRGRHTLVLADPVSFDPSLSPDGRMLAYAGGPTADATGIAIANLDGSPASCGPSQVQAGSCGPRGPNVIVDSGLMRPRWSPGGRLIAFEAFPYVDSGAVDTDYYNLWVVRPDGTHARLLMKGDAGGPGDPSDASLAGDAWNWSPNGESIAIEWPASNNPNSQGTLNVDSVDVRTGQARAVTRGGQPDWSPDGRRLVLLNATGIAIIDSDGSGLRTLVPMQAAGVANDLVEPSWSPDGKTIAYWTPGKTDDTSALKSLEIVDTSGHSPPRLLLKARGTPQKPQWSRDSQSLLASTDKGVWIVHLTPGLKAIHLSSGGDADWRG